MNNLVYTNILSNEVLQMRSNSVNDNGWKQNTNSFRVVPLYSFSGSTMSEKRSAITENCGFEVVKTSTLKKQNRKRGRPSYSFFYGGYRVFAYYPIRSHAILFSANYSHNAGVTTCNQSENQFSISLFIIILSIMISNLI